MVTRMPDENLRGSIEKGLNRLQNLEPPQLRDRAFSAVSAYVQLIYATVTGGAGPVAVPPPPMGSSRSTTGTFKCPNCGHNGTARYT